MNLIRPSLVTFVACAAALPAAAKPGDPFKTLDEAALDAIEYLRRNHPDWKKFEYGGCLYQEGDVFKASPPKTNHHPTQCVIPDPPPDTIMAGDYHNHTSLEDFSAAVDLNTNNKWPIYLLTPKGRVKKHSFTDNKTTVLK